MPPEDEDKYRFGSSLNRTTREHMRNITTAPTQRATSGQYRNTLTDHMRNITVPVNQISHKQEYSPWETPLETRFMNDPKELEKQRAMQRVDRRLEAYQTQLLNTNPEYQYALVNPMGDEHVRFGVATRAAFAVEFAARSRLAEEKFIGQEFTFEQKLQRDARRTFNAITLPPRFLGMIARNLVWEVASQGKGGAMEVVTNNPWTGDENAEVGWVNRWLTGTEYERDYFGRKINERVIPLRGVHSRDKRVYDWIKDQQTEEQKATAWGQVWPHFASKAGVVSMMLLNVTDIALVAPGLFALKKVLLTKSSIKPMVGSFENIITKSGGVWDDVVAKEAEGVSRRALRSGTALDAQRVVDDFIRAKTPEGSVGRQVVDDIESSLMREIAESRATLDALAVGAPNYQLFRDGVYNALSAERTIQRNVVESGLTRLLTEPTFVAARERATQIFDEFGTVARSSEESYLGILRPDTPAEIAEEFGAIKNELKDISDNVIGPMMNQLATLSDEVPLGYGSLDLTKNLLADSGKKNLNAFLKEVYENAQTRRISAVNTIKAGNASGKSVDEILDALDMMQRQISDVRNTGWRTTSLQRLNDYLYAEAVARGAFSRRAVGELGEQAKKVPAAVKSRREKPPVSKVNDDTFNAVKLSVGDTLIKAADDALKYKSYESFVKNSNEVVYETSGNLRFIDTPPPKEVPSTPVVLSMRQPLVLAPYGKTERLPQTMVDNLRSDVGIDRSALFMKEEITADEAKMALDTASKYGYDGVIYRDRNTKTGTLTRAVLNKNQIIPAGSFYDAIRGGKEDFGKGMDLAVRRQNQPEDIFKKALPKTRGFTALENSIVKFGVGRKEAGDIARRLQASFLLRHVRNQMFTERVHDLGLGSFRVLKGDDMYRVVIDGYPEVTGVILMKPDGVAVRLLDQKKATELYENTVTAFKNDVKNRNEKLANNLDSGVSEKEFVSKGPGHKQFNERLMARVENGTILPEYAALYRKVMLDVKDNVLKNVPMLKQGAIPGYGPSLLGKFSFTTVTPRAKAKIDPHGKSYDLTLEIQEGLDYSAMWKALINGHTREEMAQGAAAQADSLSVFLHEFGHFGHHILLNDGQKKLIKQVYDENFTPDFRKGIPGKLFATGTPSGLYADFRNYAFKNEEEFFAQAFSEYAMKNKLVHKDLEPLFERIINQLKAALSSLLSSKKSVDDGTLDRLIPLFDQILRGQGSKGRTVKVFERKKGSLGAFGPEGIYGSLTKRVSIGMKDRMPKRTPIAGTPGEFAGRRNIVSRKAIEDAKKVLQAIPKGKKVPDFAGGGIPPKQIVPLATPTPPPLLQARLPREISEIDPLSPKIIETLTPENIFGKGVRLPRDLRQGQQKLVGMVKKLQEKHATRTRQSTRAIEQIKASRQKGIDVAKKKYKDVQGRRKAFDDNVKLRRAELKEYGVQFGALEEKRIGALSRKIEKPKSLTNAMGELSIMVDTVVRRAAIASVVKRTKESGLGTNAIPPAWQDKIYEVLDPRQVRFKELQEDYLKRVQALDEFLKKNPDAVEDFMSQKTLAMLKAVEDLKKKPIKEFTTGELLEMSEKIERIWAQGRIANIIINGGTTKEISEQVPIMLGGKYVFDPNGHIVTEKLILQKKGQHIMGINELKTKSELNYITEMKKQGKIVNTDKGSLTRDKYGVEAAKNSVYSGVEEGLKYLQDVDPKKWAYMNYLSSDRVFELFDNFSYRGPMYKLLRKPVSDAVNRGDLASRKIDDAFSSKEKELNKRYKKDISEKAYEKIAMYAYLKQGLKNKMVKSFRQEGFSPKAIDEMLTNAKTLTPQEKEMYDFMREELDKMWPQVDIVMRDIHQTRIDRIKNYFPLHNQLMDSRKVHEVVLDEFTVRKRSVQKNFTKERFTVTKGYELRLNSRDIFRKNMKDVSYFVNVEPEVQRISRLINSPEFTAELGNNTYAYMRHWVDLVSRRGTPQNYVYNLWDVLHRNVGAAVLGYNISPVLKQPIALFTAAGMIGGARIARDGFSLLKRNKALLKAIENASIEQYLRAADDPSYVEYAMTKRLSNLQKDGYAWIKGVDGVTAKAVWLAAYTKKLEDAGKKFDMDGFIKGIGIDPDALDYADNIVRKTQGSGKFQDLPLMLVDKKRRFWKTLFQFQTFVLGQSQLITHDAIHRTASAIYNRTKGNPTEVKIKDAVGQSIKIGGYVGAGVYVEDQITQLLASAYGSDAWEEQLKDRDASHVALDYVATLIPPVGMLKLWFDPQSSRIGAPVLDKAFSTTRSSVGMLTKEDAEARLKDASKFFEGLIAFTTGMPGTGQVGTLFRGQGIGIDKFMQTPTEELKDALNRGDTARVHTLFQEFESKGLNVREVAEKAANSLKSDARADRRDLIMKLADDLEKCKTPEDYKRFEKMLVELERKGLVTSNHLKELQSEMKSRKRRRGLGER